MFVWIMPSWRLSRNASLAPAFSIFSVRWFMETTSLPSTVVLNNSAEPVTASWMTLSASSAVAVASIANPARRSAPTCPRNALPTKLVADANEIFFARARSMASRLSPIAFVSSWVRVMSDPIDSRIWESVNARSCPAAIALLTASRLPLNAGSLLRSASARWSVSSASSRAILPMPTSEDTALPATSDTRLSPRDASIIGLSIWPKLWPTPCMMEPASPPFLARLSSLPMKPPTLPDARSWARSFKVIVPVSLVPMGSDPQLQPDLGAEEPARHLRLGRRTLGMLDEPRRDGPRPRHVENVDPVRGRYEDGLAALSEAGGGELVSDAVPFASGSASSSVIRPHSLDSHASRSSAMSETLPSHDRASTPLPTMAANSL